MLDLPQRLPLSTSHAINVPCWSAAIALARASGSLGRLIAAPPIAAAVFQRRDDIRSRDRWRRTSGDCIAGMKAICVRGSYDIGIQACAPSPDGDTYRRPCGSAPRAPRSGGRSSGRSRSPRWPSRTGFAESNLPLVRSRMTRTVLRRVDDHLARALTQIERGERHLLGGGEVPAFARGLLIMPFVAAGIGIERDDRGEEEIVALAVRSHWWFQGEPLPTPIRSWFSSGS